MAESTTFTSPPRDKKPLAQRSSNIPSPIKSPSKIALPPSPTSSPTTKAAATTTIRITNPKAAASHTRSTSQEMMEPVIEDPMSTSNIDQKPDLVRKIAEAHLTGQTYVSPSDGIFSPTTKKLNEVKAKRFGNGKKSSLYDTRFLFARSLVQKRGREDGTGEE